MPTESKQIDWRALSKGFLREKGKKMKKFMVLVLLISVLINVTWAEIETKVDDFDKSVTISSSNLNNVDPFDMVVLTKLVKPKISYALFFWKMTNCEWWVFSNYDVELKMNDEDKIYKLDVIFTKSDMEKSVLVTSSMQIELLKIAKKATFRIHFTNQPAVVWQVPDNVLKEWQEVIKKDLTKP